VKWNVFKQLDQYDQRSTQHTEMQLAVTINSTSAGRDVQAELACASWTHINNNKINIKFPEISNT